VWVAQGTYDENITLKSGVALYGGFTGTESSKSPRDWFVHETILDGHAKGAAVVDAGSDVQEQATIDGFVIRNGRGRLVTDENSNIARFGGGIYATGASLRIANNAIEHNRADSGGGIYLSGGTYDVVSNVVADNAADGVSGSAIDADGIARFEDNDVYRNTVGYAYQDVPGTCIYCQGDGLLFVANRIHDNNGNNIASGQGAIILRNTITNNSMQFALVVDGDGARVAENVVSHNQGMGLSVYSYEAVIERNTITDNQTHTGPMGPLMVGIGLECRQAASIRDNLIAGNGASGIHLDRSSTLVNNTIVGNASQPGFFSYPKAGGIIAEGTGLTFTMINNVVAFNGFDGASGVFTSFGVSVPPDAQMTFHHNDVFQNMGTNSEGVTMDGNVSVDPTFIDRPGGNYRLDSASPLRDAGDRAAVLPGEKDLDGQDRILGVNVDIGAYEALVPGGYLAAAAIRDLRIAAGLDAATPADISIYAPGVDSPLQGGTIGVIDLLDAVYNHRAATGQR
jgi:parallel beta-helix repeat protein